MQLHSVSKLEVSLVYGSFPWSVHEASHIITLDSIQVFSLVHRPFSPPVFDCLQYLNTVNDDQRWERGYTYCTSSKMWRHWNSQTVLTEVDYDATLNFLHYPCYPDGLVLKAKQSFSCI